MCIDHRDPKCGFRMNMVAGGQSVEHAWEILSDGVEVAGAGVVSWLLWEGDALVFNCCSQSSDESWTMSWRYELLGEGQRVRAVEQIVVPAGIRTSFGCSSGVERDSRARTRPATSSSFDLAAE
jgi:hypothetical protein